MARAIPLVAVLGAMLAFALSAEAAAPNYMLVSCPWLKRPALLASWSENRALLSSLVNAPKAKAKVVRGLTRRPRCKIAEFWAWGDRASTRLSQGNQHGLFYPARRAQPAVLDLMVDGIQIPRIAPRLALTILARNGISMRIGR